MQTTRFPHLLFCFLIIGIIFAENYLSYYILLIDQISLPKNWQKIKYLDNEKSF